MSTDPIIRVPRSWLGRQALVRMPAFWRLPAHISPFCADAMFDLLLPRYGARLPLGDVVPPCSFFSFIVELAVRRWHGIAGPAAQMRILSVPLTP